MRPVGEADEETEVSLAWSEPASGGRVRAYRVQYRLGSTANPPTPGPWITVGETVTETRYRVINLEPSQRYDFQVTRSTNMAMPRRRPTRPRKPRGPGPATRRRQVTGLRLERPPQLGQIDLIWAAAAGATGYHVQQRPHNTDDAWTDCDPAPPRPKISVTKPASTAPLWYDFRVAAKTPPGSARGPAC